MIGWAALEDQPLMQSTADVNSCVSSVDITLFGVVGV